MFEKIKWIFLTALIAIALLFLYAVFTGETVLSAVGTTQKAVEAFAIPFGLAALMVLMRR